MPFNPPDPRELLENLLGDLRGAPLRYKPAYPSQLLAAAAIGRAAHVVTDMAALTSPTSSLSSMALREVVESCVNALWALTHPDDEGRFAAVDRLARRKMMPTSGLSEPEWTDRMEALESDYEQIVGDAAALPDFHSRVDAIAHLLPSETEVRQAKFLYRYLSNFRMHAGFGVLAEYLVDRDGTPALVSSPQLSNPDDDLLLAVGFLGMTIDRYRSIAGAPLGA